MNVFILGRLAAESLESESLEDESLEVERFTDVGILLLVVNMQLSE